MTKAPSHKWAFKPGMRAGLYSWKSSSKAAARLKAAVSEIKSVNKSNPVVAAEGVVALAERIWPAFEQIDTSSGALGAAVNKTLDELIPLLIGAPAEQKTRSRWLELLREAIEDDGVDYLLPIAERFGDIAVFEGLQQDHASRDIDLIRSVWSDREGYGHVSADTLTLSCMAALGQAEELRELLNLRGYKFWHYDQFYAKALLCWGQEADALAFAEAEAAEHHRSYDASASAAFCEAILLKQGRTVEAYERYALPNAYGNTYLATWRALTKSYPSLDKRRILEDLIASHGSKGKWFAAAKTAGYLDLALECAAQSEAAPQTLIRAARDFKDKTPAFAADVALHAINHLLAGRGYEPTLLDMDEAVMHLMDACKKTDQVDWAWQQLRQMASQPHRSLHMSQHLQALIEGRQVTVLRGG